MTSQPTVLFDADGVLQFAPHRWDEVLDRVGGQGFARRVYAAEEPAMAGQASMQSCVEVAIAEHRRAGGAVRASGEEILDLWRMISPSPTGLDVVQQLRERGYRCVLVTNQQDIRRDVMRPLYAPHMDGLFFSCELGVAKPHHEFFEEVLRRLNVSAQNCLFLDDSNDNIRAAHSMGLNARLVDPARAVHDLQVYVADLLIDLPS